MAEGSLEDTRPASIGTGPTVPSGDDAEPTHDIPELAKGALVARYVILSRVAAGGMGVIYAAYDPELDRKSAPSVPERPAGRHGIEFACGVRGTGSSGGIDEVLRSSSRAATGHPGTAPVRRPRPRRGHHARRSWATSPAPPPCW